jgi:hypothetical protein
MWGKMKKIDQSIKDAVFANLAKSFLVILMWLVWISILLLMVVKGK